MTVLVTSVPFLYTVADGELGALVPSTVTVYVTVSPSNCQMGEPRMSGSLRRHIRFLRLLGGTAVKLGIVTYFQNISFTTLLTSSCVSRNAPGMRLTGSAPVPSRLLSKIGRAS